MLFRIHPHHERPRDGDASPRPFENELVTFKMPDRHLQGSTAREMNHVASRRYG